MRLKLFMASAALMMAGIVSIGTTFADDNITGEQNLQAEAFSDQEADSDLENVKSVPEEDIPETGDEQGEDKLPNKDSNAPENSSGAGGTNTDLNTSADPGDLPENDGAAEGENSSFGLGVGDSGEEAGRGTEESNQTITAELSGQYLTVILKDPGNHSSASAAIWSEAGGQDDLVWYTMTKQDGETFKVSVNLGLHGTAGRYYIHVYSGNDFIAGEVIVLESFEKTEMAIETIAENEGSIVVYVQKASGYTKLRTAVWGAKNGQNDLKWYELKDTGNGSFSVVIDLTKHGENGTFYFHAYGSANGKERFLDGKEYNYKGAMLPEPAVNTELEGQILTVTAANADVFSDIRAAVWSEAGGQDDLVWYNLTKNTDGNFKAVINLVSHKSTGRFIIHVYGGSTCIGGGIVNPESISMPALTAEKMKDSESRITLTVENAYGFSNVKAAVWGTKNGQNDLKWYALEDQGDGVFKTETDLLAHKEKGKFYVHVYGTVNRIETFIDGTELDLAGISIPEPLLESELNGQIALITLSNVQEYSSARAAIWSVTNGQDDLVWYPMTRNADGSFKVKVNLGMHKSTGQFVIHAYSGNSFIAGNSLELDAFEAPALLVEEDKDDFNLVKLTVSNASGFKNVRAAVWGSKNYQNDIKWYDLKDSGDGFFSAMIDLSVHGEEGYYYFHAYGEYEGKNVFIDGLIKNISVPDVNGEEVSIDADSVNRLAQRSGDDELKVLFIGNSITWHGLADYWWGCWGMAATDADKDYVHVVTNVFNEYINTNYDIAPFVIWEVEEGNRDSLLPLLDAYLNEQCDLIVIELGENVQSESNLRADYEALFRYCSAKAPNAKILAVGTFWDMAAVDASKSAACADTGVPLVDLSDFRAHTKYQCGVGTLVSGDDGKLRTVETYHAAIHPGNFGMDKIGKRVIKAALKN